MNFDGFSPHPYDIFSSLMDEDDVTNIPVGLAAVARNVKYHGSSVRTRDGISSQWGMMTGNGNAITGLASLVNTKTQTQVPMIYDQQGNLWTESPVGSGTLRLITQLQAGSLQIAPAFLGAYIAPTNLKTSTGPLKVYNLTTGNLDPLSMRPVGQVWMPNTVYQVGEVVTPLLQSAGGNGFAQGRWFRCTVAGASGATEPSWPNCTLFQPNDGSTAVDNTVTWQENTLIFSTAVAQPFSLGGINAPGALSTNSPSSGLQILTLRDTLVGAFPAGRDIWAAVTLVNNNGETDALVGKVVINTGANDRMSFIIPVLQTLRPWILPHVTNWNLYVVDVATGAAQPALSAFQKVAGGPFSLALGTTVIVNSTPVGSQPPAVNTAFISAVGNVAGGSRWAVVLFVNRNGYINGMSGPLPIQNNFSPGNYTVLCQAIPLGPSPTTVARIVAFTAVGASNAGPYWYVPAGDLSNGINITATIINDNTTTQASFNFTDTYLQALQGVPNVTNNFRLIQVPNSSDVQFARSLSRMVYQADTIPEGFYVSNINNPEAVYGDTGLIQVAEGNGMRAITAREFRSELYLLKERAGYSASPNANDPSTWKVNERWVGVGPCGPRAVDVNSRFMCFAHRSGVYIYQGDRPYPISREIIRNWNQVNWRYQQNIVVHIDDEDKEIRIAVPWGDSVKNNKVFTCNYQRSHDPTLNEQFAPPLHQSFSGKTIASVICRKWAIDDISANILIRAERVLQNPAPDLDPTVLNNQILIGSSNPDGQIGAIIPYLFNDNGVGIDAVYETSAHEELLTVSQLGGVQANLTGTGDTYFAVLAGRARAAADGGLLPNAPAMERQLPKTFNPVNNSTGYACGASGQNERYRLRIHNNRTPNASFDLSWAAIYTRRISSARPG